MMNPHRPWCRGYWAMWKEDQYCTCSVGKASAEKTLKVLADEKLKELAKKLDSPTITDVADQKACEHNWVDHHGSNMGVPYIRQCSICGAFDEGKLSSMINRRIHSELRPWYHACDLAGVSHDPTALALYRPPQDEDAVTELEAERAINETLVAENEALRGAVTDLTRKLRDRVKS